jgi:hypothetical protein
MQPLKTVTSNVVVAAVQRITCGAVLSLLIRLGDEAM